MSVADFALIAISSIVAVMEPFSTVAVFISLTEGWNEEVKRKAVSKSMKVSAIVLVFFAITGNLVFQVFNITIASFQIAGGLLLIMVAVGMINPRKEEYAAGRRDIAIVPLTFPLTAGPGAITTVILLTSKATDLLEISFVYIGVAIAVLFSYFALRYSKALSRLLKEDGLRVVSAFMAIIILAIAVQFIIDGITAVSH